MGCSCGEGLDNRLPLFFSEQLLGFAFPFVDKRGDAFLLVAPS